MNMRRRVAFSPSRRVSSETAAFTSGTRRISSGGAVRTRWASSSTVCHSTGSCSRPTGTPGCSPSRRRLTITSVLTRAPDASVSTIANLSAVAWKSTMSRTSRKMAVATMRPTST